MISAAKPPLSPTCSTGPHERSEPAHHLRASLANIVATEPKRTYWTRLVVRERAPGHRTGRAEKVWRPAKFKRADKFDGAIETSGYSYRGLGLQLSIAQSPKG